MKRNAAPFRLVAALAALLMFAAPSFAEKKEEPGKRTEITLGLGSRSTSYARGLEPPDGAEIQPLITLRNGKWKLDLAGAFYSDKNGRADSWGFGGAFLNAGYEIPLSRRLSVFPGIEAATFPAGNFDFTWGPRLDFEYERDPLEADGKLLWDLGVGDGVYGEGSVKYPFGPFYFGGTVGFSREYFGSTGLYLRPEVHLTFSYGGTEFDLDLSYTTGLEREGFQEGYSIGLAAIRKLSLGENGRSQGSAAAGN